MGRPIPGGTAASTSDLVRYAGLYPLFVAAFAVALSAWSARGAVVGVASLGSFAGGGLLASALVACVGGAGDDATDPSYEVYDVVTGDCAQRARVRLFTAGTVVWGALGVAVILG